MIAVLKWLEVQFSGDDERSIKLPHHDWWLRTTNFCTLKTEWVSLTNQSMLLKSLHFKSSMENNISLATKFPWRKKIKQVQNYYNSTLFPKDFFQLQGLFTPKRQEMWNVGMQCGRFCFSQTGVSLISEKRHPCFENGIL